MDIIKLNLDEWIRNWLSGIVYSNIESMMNEVNSDISKLSEVIIARPSLWSPEIWNMITNVADKVIFPIAAAILAFVMSMELFAWAKDKNNMHDSSEITSKFIWFVVKLGIGVLLLLKSKDITIQIFDLGAWAISQATGINTNPEAMNISMTALKTALEDAEIGTLMGLTFTSMFGSIGLSAMGLVARLVVTGRMIEIYIYCSVGSAPYATLTNSKMSSIGANYIKNLLALAFQGFFMFLMLGIYSVLMFDAITKVAGGSDPLGLISEMLFIAGVLCMMLLRSKSISKSIFSAQ